MRVADTQALEKALKTLTPPDVEREVTQSGLRGRGGANFPVGAKWSFVNKKSPVVYLCCNADEGEPGTFKDRWILEHTPHQLIEGMLIAAYALNVRHAFIYIRGEFDLPLRRLQGALEEAQAARLVGERILDSAFACDIVVHRGAGAYVCGEESSLLNSLEGRKGYPRNKPPFPAVRGLYQAPTVVNNVETLSDVPWIVAHGGAAYAALGNKSNPGTRLFGISGHVKKPARLRAPDRLSDEAHHLRRRGRNPRRQTTQGSHSRRQFHARAHRCRDREHHARRRLACSKRAACSGPAASSSLPKARAWCACCMCSPVSTVTSPAGNARLAARAPPWMNDIVERIVRRQRRSARISRICRTSPPASPATRCVRSAMRRRCRS